MCTFHRNGRAPRRPAHPEDRAGAGAQGPVADGQQVTAEERAPSPAPLLFFPSEFSQPPLRAELIGPARSRLSSPLRSGCRAGATPEFCLNLFTFAVTRNAHGVPSDMWIFVCMLCEFDHTVSAFSSITPPPPQPVQML